MIIRHILNLNKVVPGHDCGLGHGDRINGAKHSHLGREIRFAFICNDWAFAFNDSLYCGWTLVKHELLCLPRVYPDSSHCGFSVIKRVCKFILLLTVRAPLIGH